MKSRFCSQFHIYNAVLRRWPTDIFEQLKKVDNMFTTTIHVLVSAVQKVARVMKLHEGLVLYRGLGGTMELPDHFLNVDDNGCRGFAEWGFMSTTADKSIAIQYSGVREGKPLAMLFEIQVSSVDRGACIRDFSQYPGEVEYLWVPCSFVEPSGSPYLEVTQHGVASVVRVRVNANLRALTVEDVLEMKKQAHLVSFKYLLDETRRDLYNRAEIGGAAARLSKDLSIKAVEHQHYTVDYFLNGILEQCKEVFARHECESAEVFNVSESCRGLVIEMLEARTTAVSKLELWLQDESRLLRFDYDVKLRIAHRNRIAYLERKLPKEKNVMKAALTLCQVKGLVQKTVEDTNDLGEIRIISAAAEDVSCRNIMLLIQAGSNVNAVDPEGQTALFKAAIAGRDDTVQTLIENKAEVNHQSQIGDTALICAALEGHAECVRTLGKFKADVAIREDNNSPAIYFASQQGHVECVRALLELGADAHHKNEQQQTLLLTSAYHGHADCVLLYVEVGVDINAVDKDGMTAAMFCAYLGHAECLRVLKDAGADMNLEDKDGNTALSLAERYNQPECCVILEGTRRGRCSGWCEDVAQRFLSLTFAKR